MEKTTHNEKLSDFNLVSCLSTQLITIFAIIIAFCISADFANAQSITIDISKPGATVAPVARGQQIEEFNHQFQGGLYAQLISNSSFEEWNKPTDNCSVVKAGSSNGSINGRKAVDEVKIK